MTRSMIGVLLIAVATIISCDANRPTETVVNQTVIPPKGEPPVKVDPPVFTTLEILPQADTVFEGVEKNVYFVARDQGQHLIWTRGSLSFTSSDTAVVKVTPYGFMTAVGGGTATISVTETIAGVTLTATAGVTVIAATPLPSVLLTADLIQGWQPAIAHLIAGGTVTWKTAGPLSWSDVPHDKLYLLDYDYREIDSLDLSTGSATLKLDTPGVYRYCSAGCWDPPDFGLIYVH